MGQASLPAGKGLVLKAIIQAYSYVLLWMSISIAVILFNKWVLAYSGFPFPIALTLWHMTFCSAVGFVAVRVLKLVKSHNMTAREYCTRVMPIGLLYAGSLWLSNSAYLYLSVSFIQMTKSLMPGLVYACGCVVGTEAPQLSAALNMALIAAGVVVCALGELNLVAVGLLQQLVALAFEAMRLTLVQVLMNSKGYNMNPLQSLYYVSPACLLSLLLPFACVEYPKILAARAASKFNLNGPVLLANALAAFALNLAVFMLIGKTSALTMNIAGVIKDWMLIFLSFYLFHAPVTTLNLAGYIFCCSGVVWYNHSKLRALKAKAAQQDGKCDEDLEQARLQSRTKADILRDIQQLQHEVDMLDKRAAAAEKIKAGHSSSSSSFGNLTSSTVRIIAGGDSSGSSSPGAGVLREQENARAIAALSSKQRL